NSRRIALFLKVFKNATMLTNGQNHSMSFEIPLFNMLLDDIQKKSNEYMDAREKVVNLIRIQDCRSSSEAQKQIIAKELLE
ncbi:hypothetical protein HK096_006010, partial [Nowakowskiella sp. JEL0078]